MSVITETEPGGEMICILGFSARPRDPDNRPVQGKRREFRVGERVRYLTSFFKGTPEDNPTGYMAVFEPRDPVDKNRYSATENYFVTLDCWEGLRKHFASTLVVLERDLNSKGADQVAYTLKEDTQGSYPLNKAEIQGSHAKKEPKAQESYSGNDPNSEIIKKKRSRKNA